MYAVYLTNYKGKKLPKFYIGSTTLDKILSGNYFGSIKSKKYKEIFEYELKNNKHLFSIEILSIHKNRKEALEEEFRIQKQKNVVKSPDYFNMSYASVNGFFGMQVYGKKHPAYGKTNKSRLGMKNSLEMNLKIGDSQRGRKRSDKTREKMSKSAKGRILDIETKMKLSKSAKERKEFYCDKCDRIIKGTGNYSQHIKSAIHNT